MFEKALFLKPPVPLNRTYTGENFAPLFRKRFVFPAGVKRAVLSVCGLGIGKFYLNGIPVSADLFTAPVSNYCKTLWYNQYEVTHLLHAGENVVAATCGNGFFNEEFRTPWQHNTAAWRDLPQMILQLDADGETVLCSDETWLCKSKSAVTFNALRSGEHFDLSLYDASWNTAACTEEGWMSPVAEPAKATFRLCMCEPIRECAVLEAKQVYATGEGQYLYDFGQNLSGYVRLTVEQGMTDMLTFRYTEQVHPDLTPDLHNMDIHYPECPFQTDCFHGDGRPFTWSPSFAYHGFRYVLVSGLHDPGKVRVNAVFVHQDVRRKSAFSCSEPFLNRLFEAGIVSCYSNMLPHSGETGLGQ